MPPISNSSARNTHRTTNRPAASKPPATTPPPTRSNGGPRDGISLSSEALELANTSNAERCGNDWRCLQELDRRGLLS